MGWALKTITKKAGFTQKQNEFLKQQFEIGEQSGRKADPSEVSKLMRSTRDELGARRFQPEEVLPGQQIAGFFSRLAAKKKLIPSTVNGGDSDYEVPHGTKNWIYSKFDLDQKSRSNVIKALIQTLTRANVCQKCYGFAYTLIP